MRRLARLWKTSLTVQLLSSMLLALVASQVVSLAILWDWLQSDIRASARAELGNRAAAVAHLFEVAPPGFRDDVIRISSTDTSRFWVSEAEPVTRDAWVRRAFLEFDTPLDTLLETAEAPRIATRLPADADAHYFLKGATWTGSAGSLSALPRDSRSLDFASRNGAGVIVPLTDGTYLNAAYHKALPPTLWRTHLPLSLTLAAIFVSMVGVLTIRRIARPLRDLTLAAGTLGRGEPVPPIDPRGPEDIRRMTIAFNDMQERLHRFVADRTRMLAAIGHDLRTPLTTLRLRAELVEDAELQERMLATIDEMQTMTEATLSLARQEISAEPTRTIDLTSLVESVCDDLAELGEPVRYLPSARLTYRCRPEELRRAIRNLVENAVRYAGGADVRVVSDTASVSIFVDDDGPGIPVDRLEEVFAPFFRLEDSRSRETGGIGLGLSIARAVARQHGGDIVLCQRDPGLRAAVVLPA